MAALIIQGLLNDDEDDDYVDLRVRRREIRDSSNPFELTRQQFAENYRFEQAEVLELVELIRPHVQGNNRVNALPLEFKVRVQLYDFKLI